MDRLHFRTPLRPTPFHPRTAPLNLLHRWGPWAGCVTALCYGDAAMEHTAIRNAAGLYDLSPMIKYRIRGPEAADYLNRLTLRDAGGLAVGAVHYTAWCDDAGKVEDDGTLFRLAAQDYLLTCQERHLPWLLTSAEGFDVSVADETEDWAGLALQGPCAATILEAAGVAVADLAPFRHRRVPLAGGEILLSRTGFTGDLGYELWCPPALALPVWDALMAAGGLYGLRAVGSDALNIARIEAGFLMTHADFIPASHALREDRARSPFELGLGWMIDWRKGHFTGRAALMAERERESDWALVGLDVPGNIPADGAILYSGKRHEAGVVTSACWSPVTKRSLALAQVRTRALEEGDLWAEIYALRELQYAKLMLPVTVAKRPFFAPARRRAMPPGRV